MKQQIDWEKVAEAERFGALALSSDPKHRKGGTDWPPFTAAQSRALSELARSLVHVAKKAGAVHGRIAVGDVSFELRENGVEEVLSIRTAAAS